MNYKLNVLDKSIELNDTFDLQNTLACGQCFRFEQVGDSTFVVVAQDKASEISIEKNKLVFSKIENESLDFWVKYFDLELNYNEIINNLCDLDDNFKKIASQISGIRILNQDVWEALCSFIISQNNNIPRIKGIIRRLCQHFGEKINGWDGLFSFPGPQVIARLQEEDLAVLKAGFRAKYLIDAAKKVSSGEVNLKSLESMNLEDARFELMKIKGVGPKVADCTLLYGCHKLQAFPMDVWMKRAMQKLYPGQDGDIFGEYAGIAQQYIFHYSRLHPEIFS